MTRNGTSGDDGFPFHYDHGRGFDARFERDREREHRSATRHTLIRKHAAGVLQPLVPVKRGDEDAPKVVREMPLDGASGCEHLVEVLSRDGRTLENAVRRCARCGEVLS